MVLAKRHLSSASSTKAVKESLFVCPFIWSLISVLRQGHPNTISNDGYREASEMRRGGEGGRALTQCVYYEGTFFAVPALNPSDLHGNILSGHACGRQMPGQC